MKAADINSGFHLLTVKNIVNETAQAKSFVLRTQKNDLHLFRYQPGQFLTFQIPLQKGLIERSYSISSAQCFDPDMTVCVKRVLNGRGSNWFNDQLQIGTTIRSRVPAGRFTLDDKQTNLLIIAGGSGITPCISLIKHTLFETSRKVKLVYANQDSQSIIYLNVLNLLQKRFPDQFECVHWLDNEKGLMGPRDVLASTHGHENASCYICGPALLMDMAQDVLMDSFGSTLNIKTERFISPEDPALGGEIESSSEPAGNEFLAEFQLQFEGRIHAVRLAAGQTLLQAALASDLDIPRSCTQGHCGSCIAKLCDGEVSMTSTKALSKRNIERGHILLCQSYPASEKSLFVNLDF